MNESDRKRIADFSRWLDHLPDGDARIVLTSLVSHLLASFKSEAESVKWLKSFEKTVRQWVEEVK